MFFFFIPQTEEFGHLGIVMTSRCEVAIKSIQRDDLNLVFIGIIHRKSARKPWIRQILSIITKFPATLPSFNFWIIRMMVLNRHPKHT